MVSSWLWKLEYISLQLPLLLVMEMEYNIWLQLAQDLVDGNENSMLQCV